jgi:hypothetical protein
LPRNPVKAAPTQSTGHLAWHRAARFTLIFDDFNSCVEKFVEKNPMRCLTVPSYSDLRKLHTDGAAAAEKIEHAIKMRN